MERQTRDSFNPVAVLDELRADSIYDDGEVRRLLEECCHALIRDRITLDKVSATARHLSYALTGVHN